MILSNILKIFMKPSSTVITDQLHSVTVVQCGNRHPDPRGHREPHPHLRPQVSGGSVRCQHPTGGMWGPLYSLSHRYINLVSHVKLKCFKVRCQVKHKLHKKTISKEGNGKDKMKAIQETKDTQVSFIFQTVGF